MNIAAVGGLNFGEVIEMNPKMLHLAERLVVAMETISQDVKNMSAYVYDISCGVSYLLNENKMRECISVVAHDEGDNSPSATSAAGQENSAEEEYSEQCEQLDETSLHVGDPEHGESSFGDMAPMSTDPYQNSNVQSSENNSTFTERIKTEELSEDEVNDESCEMLDIHGNSGATDRDYGTDPTAIPNGHAITQQRESAVDASVVHMGVNRETISYECSVCHKSFKSRSEFRRHFRVHSGERPYKCNICGKTFSQKGNLTKHMLSHTGERPYKCDTCEKAFSEKANLMKHIRTHTGEKPFKCTLCGKLYAQNYYLRTHMRVHTREKPYKCSLCGKAFRYRYGFNKHRNTHSAEHLFQ